MDLRSRIVVGLLLCVAAAVAQEETETPEQAADQVLAAVQASDTETLKALAERDEPDPWLVADELCFRGERGAAVAFAKAAPRPDTERLAEYVERWEGRELVARQRELLVAIRDAASEQDHRALSTPLRKSLEAGKETVAGVSLLWAIGRKADDH